MTVLDKGSPSAAVEATTELESASAHPLVVVPVAAAGARALIGVAVAIVGVLAAVNPDSVLLRALNQAMPQLADAVPTLITTCGALVAAFSQPPKLRRRA